MCISKFEVKMNLLNCCKIYFSFEKNLVKTNRKKKHRKTRKGHSAKRTKKKKQKKAKNTIDE